MAQQKAIKKRKISRENEIRFGIDSLVQEADDLVKRHPKRAIELCNEADELLHDCNYPQGTIENTLVRAAAFMAIQKHNQAKEMLQNITTLCTTHGTVQQQGWRAFYMGTCCIALSDFAQVLHHAEQSIAFFQQDSAPLHEAKARILLNAAYTKLAMYPLALEQAFSAYALFQQFDNKEGISKALNNIGAAYHQWDKFDQALEFFHKSLVIKRELGDEQGTVNTLNNIGHILFWTKQKYHEALDYYNQACTLAQAHKDKSGEATALQHIGQVYVYVEQYDKALQYSLQALAISRNLQAPHETAYMLMDLGFVYIKANQAQQSIEVIHEGIEIAKKIQARNLLSKGYNLLRQIYRELGDFENAVLHYENYINIQEVLFTEASDKKVQQLTIQFEVEKAKQEKELYRLRSEKLEQDIEHKTKELTTTAMLLAQKNEFLGNINQQIEKALQQPTKNAKPLLQSLNQQIRETMRSEESWVYFEQQFKLVHHDFTQRVSELYPTLTPMELKMSALLRMHLSTKEIANLLYQSPRSIEAYRYRLRKKMNIPADVNLSTHLASL